MSDLSHKSKVLLYVIGELNSLRDKGFVKGGIFITPQGEEQLKQLRESGFKPTEDEIHAAIAGLQGRYDK